jgi:protein-tyrosine-phosphatase
MNDRTRLEPIGWMAFGYFAFYIPYSLLTKWLTQGAPAAHGSVPTGLQILPATMIATAVVFPMIVTVLGWWKYSSRGAVLGANLPIPGRITLVSGIAFAVIIGATTLAYTFRGISILFALLLMRGGVLILAPIVDTVFHRRVRWYSWASLIVSFIALAIAFADVGGYNMTIAALLNLAAYLGGYVFRLSNMTLIAKIADPALSRRYLVEESIAASLALVAIPAIFAVITPGEPGVQLRYGFTTIFTTPFALPALSIGVLYALLGMFGTMVYLNPRESTFAVPVNRCASLFSGVAASLISVWLFGAKTPTYAQFLAAATICVAIAFLSVPAGLEARKRSALGFDLSERVLVFVCSGNTSRSPMAEALCNAEAARRLAALGAPRTAIRAISAGISIQPGAETTELARSTLEQLGLPGFEHTATKLTRDMIRKAQVVFCMTEDQREKVIREFPQAAWKTFRVDTAGDLDDPSKLGPDAYASFAHRVADCIDRHLESMGLPRVQPTT